jgi:hypothetical protein
LNRAIPPAIKFAMFLPIVNIFKYILFTQKSLISINHNPNGAHNDLCKVIFPSFFIN